jgi:hypothetical protein
MFSRRIIVPMSRGPLIGSNEYHPNNTSSSALSGGGFVAMNAPLFEKIPSFRLAETGALQTRSGRLAAVAGTLTLLGTLIGCGTNAKIANPSNSETTSVGTRAGAQNEGPVINWDKPLGEGPIVADLATAMRVGRLSFTPIQPRFSQPPTSIQVAQKPNELAIAFVYNFPRGRAFPTDGRVQVLETVAAITSADLLGVIHNPPGPAQDFVDIHLGEQDALLIQSDGIGRVQFIEAGVEFDVAGPALSVAEAQTLGRQLADR